MVVPIPGSSRQSEAASMRQRNTTGSSRKNGNFKEVSFEQVQKVLNDIRMQIISRGIYSAFEFGKVLKVRLVANLRISLLRIRIG